MPGTNSFCYDGLTLIKLVLYPVWLCGISSTWPARADSLVTCWLCGRQPRTMGIGGTWLPSTARWPPSSLTCSRPLLHQIARLPSMLPSISAGFLGQFAGQHAFLDQGPIDPDGAGDTGNSPMPAVVVAVRVKRLHLQDRCTRGVSFLPTASEYSAITSCQPRSVLQSLSSSPFSYHETGLPGIRQLKRSLLAFPPFSFQ